MSVPMLSPRTSALSLPLDRSPAPAVPSPRLDLSYTPRTTPISADITSATLDNYDPNWRYTAPVNVVRELCLLRKRFLLSEFLRLRDTNGKMLIKPLNANWNLTIVSDLIHSDEGSMLDSLLQAKIATVTPQTLTLAAAMGTTTFATMLNFLPEGTELTECLPTVRGYLRSRQREDLLALLEAKL